NRHPVVYHQYPINPERVKPCSHSHIMLEFNTPRCLSHSIYSPSRRADQHQRARNRKTASWTTASGVASASRPPVACRGRAIDGSAAAESERSPATTAPRGGGRRTPKRRYPEPTVGFRRAPPLCATT